METPQVLIPPRALGAEETSRLHDLHRPMVVAVIAMMMVKASFV